MKTLRIMLLGFSSARAAVIISLYLPLGVFGQGFMNLDFESAQLLAGGPPNTVSSSAAFPEWTAYIGANQQSTVLYNNATLGASSVAILAGGSFSPSPVIDGAFSAMLVAGDTGNPSLSQTALVPSGTASIFLSAYIGGGQVSTADFSVSLGSQTIPMTFIELLSGYTVYGGDVSSFAGTTATLQITSLYQGNGGVNAFVFDDVQFSSQAVPEPSGLGLVGVGAVFIALRRLREDRR